MKRVELIAGIAFTTGLLVAVGWIGLQVMGGGNPDSVVVADPEPEDDTPAPTQKQPPSLKVDRTENIVQSSPLDDPDNDEPVVANPELGTLLGRVVSPKGEPVPGADIELARGPTLVMSMPGLRNSTGITTQTDSEGKFRLVNLEAADDYLVVAMHPDYGDSVAGPFDLELGETETIADIRLVTGIQVFGFVGANGRPIAGALVSLTNTSSGFSLKPEKEPVEDDVVLTVTTRNDGTYSFDTVPVNSFEVTAEADGYGRQTRSNRSLFSAPQDTQIDFDLNVANRISGIVMDETRRPIAGAQVDANLAGEQFRCDAKAVTGEDGRFELTQLNDGFYHLTVRCDDYSSNTKPRIAANSTNLEVTLLRQGSVQGRVVDARDGSPVTSFRIHVLRSIQGRDPARTAIFKDVSDPNGNFEISGLDPNTYMIEARADGYAPCNSEEVRVVRGEMQSGITVSMNRGGTVTGRVMDSNGKPVRNALVRINPNDFSWNPVHDLMEKMAQTDDLKRQVRSDKEGNFTLDLVVPGIYQVAARHPRYASSAMNNIEVKLDEINAIGQLILPVGGTVEGYAKDTDGSPLVGATVNAISKQSDYKQVRCNNEGFFRIAGLRAGEYTISIASYASDPPENILVQMIKAKNSAQTVTMRDGDKVSVNLQLTEQQQN